MPTTHKVPKKQVASHTGRILPDRKKASVTSQRDEAAAVISQRQLKAADKMLGRIERRGEALSANADRLLKRVS